MAGPDEESCQDPQSVDCVTPPVNSSPLGNGMSAMSECLSGADAFRPQEHESLRLRFQQDNSPNTINDFPPEIIIQILHAVLDETINVPHFERGHYLAQRPCGGVEDLEVDHPKYRKILDGHRVHCHTRRNRLASGKILHFTIMDKAVFLTIPGAWGHVGLRICCTDPDELGRWLVEELISELSSIRELELAVDSRYTESELQVLPKLLEAVRNVERLRCPYLKGVAAALLAEHLALPYQADDGLHWHWPKLVQLRLSDTGDWSEPVFNMFLMRYGVSQVEDEEDEDTTSADGPYHYP